MARGKVQMKRIENPVQRQVTFCKRRIGLLKKAKELSVLCDADIGVLIFSAQGKLYELSTKGSMQELVERYMKSTRATYEPDQVKETQPQPLDTKEEIDMLKLEIQILQKGLRHVFGGETAEMALDELLVLEKHLEFWMFHVRSTKMDIMCKEIQLLRNKEGILVAANQHLQDEIEKNVNVTNFTTPANDTPLPLNRQNGIFQC